MEVKLKYQLGEQIKLNDKNITIVGFEYVMERGTRYIVLWVDGKPNWEYLYDFEIEALK